MNKNRDTRRTRHPGRWLLLAVAAFALPCAAAPKAQSDALPESVLDQVYTLEEAADFLRSPVAEVERMAREGGLPGRTIGGQWRFSRISLVQWLNQDRPLKIVAIAPREERRSVAQREQLARAELAQYSGRGGASTGAAPMPEPTIPKVGEASTTKSAEQVFLRDQGVLLKARQATVEFGLSYQKSQQSQTLVNNVTLNGVNLAVISSPQRVESNTVNADVSLRYGLMDDLQLTATMPYRYRRNAAFLDTDAAKETNDKGGDLSLGVLGVAMRESVGRPTLIWSLNAIAPTGGGDKGVGAGLSLAKSYDPVVLFAGLSYMHGLDTDFNDPNRVLAKHNVGFNAGYAFAVNDSIALSGQLIGSYRSYGTDPRGFRLAREQYQLQFGLTYLLTPSVYVEPTVGIGLGGDSPDLSFGVRIPYTF